LMSLRSLVGKGRGRDVRFAVTAPWGVEFHENVFISLHHDILVVVRYDDFDGTVLLL